MCLNGASQRTNSISDFYHFFSGVITLLALAGSGGIHVLWNFSSIFKKMFASSFGSCSVKIKGCNAIPSKLMGSFLVV